jgi:cardiolipin synthase
MSRVFLLAFMMLSTAVSWGENSAERTKRDFRRLGLPVYEGNRARILPTAEIKFRDLFEAIDGAESYILLDYFKFQQDSICGLLIENLCRKVREGVQVYVLFDSFGNHDSDFPLSDTLQARIRGAGVNICAFDPVRFPWINHLFHRDHHKIAVVDGKTVYTGGMNVADYYLHGKPKVGRWRDMHIRIDGPIAEAYEELFWKMWEKEQTPSPLPHKGECLPSPMGEVGGGSVAFVSRWPKETPKVIRQAYCISIDNADRLVQIINPYAMLFGEVRSALRRALERGVKVQFMVSTKSDGKMNDDVIGLEMRKLMKRGAEVFYYDDGFHHSKVMMIDSLFCTVGTANLDARSLRFDYEVNAFIFDRATTHELQQIFRDDSEKSSTRLTPEVFKERFPLRRRIRGRIFSIAKRFL